MAVRLYVEEETSLGALNFYSTEREDLAPEAESIAPSLPRAPSILRPRRTRSSARARRPLLSGGAIGVGGTKPWA
jgi:hypothetical protein